MSDPTNKAELLARMRKGYADFEALLGPLSDTQLTTPGVNGEWSIKDMLAHLATWQARAAQILEAASRNEKPELDPPIQNDEDMNRFNDERFIANRSLPLDQAWWDFRASYQRFLRAVEVLSEEDLFNAGRFAWMKGNALGELVAGDSFEHYDEHAPMIEKWLALQQV